MCVICGCHEGAGSAGHGPERRAPTPEVNPMHGQDLHFGRGPAGASVPGMSPERAIAIETKVLGENQRHADGNRQRFHAQGVLALNFVSSPGSGKTTLLCETLLRLRAEHPAVPVAVIEGDQQTSFDAERIRATGAPAVQVNTGKGCHLDAQMVEQAAARLPLGPTGGILLIENVGNLVCPAMWDLGEAAKVAVLSVTEGEDKPLKYPDMFAAADLMILNKIDLLPHVRFDVQAAIGHARRVNPRIEVLQLSATGGEGLDAWLHWLLHALDHARGTPHGHHGHAGPQAAAAPEAVGDELARLKARVAELEAALRPAAGR